jgi:hypothetical protein
MGHRSPSTGCIQAGWPNPRWRIIAAKSKSENNFPVTIGKFIWPARRAFSRQIRNLFFGALRSMKALRAEEGRGAAAPNLRPWSF